MAVNVSKSGGIYIEISGDYAKLQEDLRQADALAKAAGKGISDALAGALSPKDAARNASSLAKYLSTAQRAAQATKADFSGADAQFRAMGQAIGMAEKDLARFVGMQRQMLQTQSAKAFTDNLRGIQRLTGASNEEMNRLAKSLGGVGNEFSNASRSATAFGSCIEGVVTKYGGMILGAQSLQAALTAVGQSVLQVDRLNKSYTTIYDSAGAAGQQLNYLYAVSDNLGLQFQSTAEAAKTFFAAGKGTALDGELNRIFSSVSSAGTALSLSKDEMQGIFLALGQMISKGKVQAEELRGQLGERLPGAFKLAAQAMGMTTAELDKLMADGKITAEMLLPKLATELDKAFGGKAVAAAQGLQGQLNRLSTEWERFKGGLADSDSLAGAVGGAAQSMKTLADYAPAIGTAIKETTAVIGAAAVALGAYKLAASATSGALGEKALAESASRVSVVASAKADMEAALALQAEARAAQSAAWAKAANTTSSLESMAAARALSAAEVSLAQADALVISSKNTLTAATARATVAQRGLATASSLGAKAGQGLLSMFGGPWGLALTAAAGAVAYFATRESEAEQISKQYGVTLQSVADQYNTLAQGAKGADQATQDFTKAQVKALEISRDKIREQVAEIKQDIAGSFVLDVAIPELQGDALEKIFSTKEIEAFNERQKELVRQFQAGEKSAEDLVLELGNIKAELELIAGKSGGFSEKGRDAKELGGHVDLLVTKFSILSQLLDKLGSTQINLAIAVPDLVGDFSAKASADRLKAIGDIRDKIAKEYAKTPEGKIEAAKIDVDAAKSAVAELEKLGATQENVSRATAVLTQKQKELKDVLTPKKTGGRGGEFAENRAVKYAEDAYKKAEDAAEQLRLKNEELAASLNGDTMAASLAKIEGQYKKQVAAIEKDTSDLMAKAEEWSKKGLLTPEVQGFIEQYKEQNQVRIQGLETERQHNKELAKRSSLESALGFRINESELLKEKTDALTGAYNKGYISLEQYNIRLRNTGLELAKLHQEQGLSTWTEDATLALARITEGYEGVAAGLAETFGDFFENFTQGFADSVGRAVVDSENLGEAMHNVAKSAISSLISGLVQLGMQWAITQLTMSTASQVASKATAVSVAADNATILSSAAPAAAAESAATFGGAAVAGAAALALAFGLMIGTMMSGFRKGGYTGNAGKDEVTGVVHGGEYVFNADSVRRIGLSQLEAMQRGSVGANPSSGKAPVAAFGGASNSSSGPMPNMNVSIENYGTSKAFEVEQLSESEIRIIARDEAREVTREYAPKVIASSIGNPNSSVSKSLGKNTKAERRR